MIRTNAWSHFKKLEHMIRTNAWYHFKELEHMIYLFLMQWKLS